MKCIKVTYPDINNGLGVRATVWFAGCSHHCKGCHNEWTWDYSIGNVWKKGSKEWNELIEALSKDYINGVTFSGGDPLAQSEENLQVMLETIWAMKLLFPKKDIWLYTGYYLDDIIKDKDTAKTRYEIVSLCDYIVDGPFELDQKDLDLAFRGSGNQTIWKNNKGTFEKYEVD